MPVTRAILRATFAVALLTTVSPAWADAYDAAFARAIAAKERALDERDPARWEEALDRFAEADRLRATKEGKYELGSAAARLRQDDLAVDAYRAALELGLDGPAADKARQFVSEHDSGMARLELVAPEGAEVSVRGRRRGRIPVTISVFAGDTMLEVTRGSRSVEHAVSARAGAEQRVDLSAEFLAPQPPRGGGDGLPDGTTPRTPPPSGPSPAAWPLVIGGGTLAVAGTMTVLLTSSSVSSHRDTLAQLCAVPGGSDQCQLAEPGKRQAAQDEVDAIATQKAIRVGGFIGLGVGVAAAGTGAILLLSHDPAPTAARVAIAPGPGAMGISVHGAL